MFWCWQQHEEQHELRIQAEGLQEEQQDVGQQEEQQDVRL